MALNHRYESANHTTHFENDLRCQVDVTAAELDEHMSRIRKAMHPCTTVMDYTLACAFYFASRGIGMSSSSSSSSSLWGLTTGHIGNLITQGTTVAETKHRSDVSVLLMGNGADEQLAGYGRHKTRFTRGGWAGLQAELERDTQRLWTRNLGVLKELTLCVCVLSNGNR